MKRVFAFRVDDITPDMDWERFEKLSRLFDKYEIKPLIGIVPDNKDEKLHKEEPREDFWQQIELMRQKGWSMAQHGCYHVYETKSAGIFHLRRQSEFAGLPYSIQKEKILHGQEILRNHGVLTDVFFAPSNTYDRNTLKILKEAGFQYLPTGYTKYPYYENGLLFIPAKHSEPDYEEGFVTIYLHPNTMSDAFMDSIEGFLEEHKDEVMAYDVFIQLALHNTHTLRSKIELPVYICGKNVMRYIRRKIGSRKKV